MFVFYYFFALSVRFSALIVSFSFLILNLDNVALFPVNFKCSSTDITEMMIKVDPQMMNSPKVSRSSDLNQAPKTETQRTRHRSLLTHFLCTRARAQRLPHAHACVPSLCLPFPTALSSPKIGCSPRSSVLKPLIFHSKFAFFAGDEAGARQRRGRSHRPPQETENRWVSDFLAILANFFVIQIHRGNPARKI